MSKQKLSLQEQLLKSGLVSSAKAKTIQTNKRKQSLMQRKNNVVVVDEAKELALKAQTEKTEKDRELNQLRQQQEEQKQGLAQIKQLIAQNHIDLSQGDVAYHFNDQNRMKTVYVTESVRTQLINGHYAIVSYADTYTVVPYDVAEKIALRDARCVILLNSPTPNANSSDEDPYAAYQIPDDLIW